MAHAMLTLNDKGTPGMGMRARMSRRFWRPLRIPPPSEPSTSASGNGKVNVVAAVGDESHAYGHDAENSHVAHHLEEVGGG